MPSPDAAFLEGLCQVSQKLLSRQHIAGCRELCVRHQPRARIRTAPTSPSSASIVSNIQRSSIGVGTIGVGAATVVEALELVCVVWSLVTLAVFVIVPVTLLAMEKVTAEMVMLCPIATVPKLHGNPPAHGVPAEANVRPAGAGSARMALVASAVPEFVT